MKSRGFLLTPRLFRAFTRVPVGLKPGAPWQFLG